MIDGSKTPETVMKPLWAMAALLVVFFYSPTSAADAPVAAGATIGTGTFSCGKFSKYDSAPNNSEQMDLVVQWAWGFMSSYNNRAAFAPTFQEEDAPNPVAPPNAKTLLAFIRNYCKVKPDSSVAQATLDLISVLGGIVTSSISL